VQHCLGGGADTEEARNEEETALLAALEGIDCVFSTVTPHVQHALEADFHATNDRGVRHLVNACLKKGTPRLVHLSSIAVTSHFTESKNQSEADSLPSLSSYESPYDVSKRRGEDAVLEANHIGQLVTCSLRAGGICLSPHDFAFANMWPIIPGLIMQPTGGKKIDFIDGRDVCCAMLLAAQGLGERPEDVAGEAFFVTKGESTTPGDLGKCGAQVLGLPFIGLPDLVIHIVYVMTWLYVLTRKALGMSVPGVPPHRFLMMLFTEMTFDNSKAHTILHWSPKVKIADSVERIVHLHTQEVECHTRPRCKFISPLTVFMMTLFIVPPAVTWPLGAMLS